MPAPIIYAVAVLFVIQAIGDFYAAGKGEHETTSSPAAHILNGFLMIALLIAILVEFFGLGAS